MHRTSRLCLFSAAALLILGPAALPLPAQIRDGGIDPWNLGKGDWIYYSYDGLPFIIVSYKNGSEYRYDGIQISDGKPGEE